MALGDQTGVGYQQPASPSQYLSSRDVGRAAIGGVVPQAEEVINAAVGTAGGTGAGTASVGTASAQVVAARAGRLGALFVNDSNAKIYLGLGTAAVVGSGVPLAPGGSWDGLVSGVVWTGQVTAIATAASSTLAYVDV